MPDIPARFRIRRDTAAIWASINPILADGEAGFETDTNILRIGNGVSAYTALEPLNADAAANVDALAGLILSANKGLYSTGPGLLALFDFTAWARSFLGSTGGPEAQVALGIGTLVSAVVGFPTNTAPAGWLKANGAAVSRTTYAALFAKLQTAHGAGNGTTTFNLPDYRGYFLRAWDDARGIDPGRAIGSIQADANLSHAHTGTTSVAGHTHTSSSRYVQGSSQGTNGSTNITLLSQVSNSADHDHTLNVVNDGGAEARPKNISLLYCIKY